MSESEIEGPKHKKGKILYNDQDNSNQSSKLEQNCLHKPLISILKDEVFQNSGINSDAKTNHEESMNFMMQMVRRQHLDTDGVDANFVASDNESEDFPASSNKSTDFENSGEGNLRIWCDKLSQVERDAAWSLLHLADFVKSNQSSQKSALRASTKKTVKFSSVTVYKFQRVQGFISVPTTGGCTLGMEMRHYHKEIKWLSNGGKDANQATTSNGNNTNSCSLLPVSVQQRCALLKASGVNIDYKEIKDCNRLRSSRADCGCKCIHSCNPDTCTCSIENIKCHLERTSFPCSCTSDSCRNPNGRIEYNKKSMHTKIQNILNNIK